VPAAGITIGEKGRIKIFLFLFDDLKKNPNEVINLIGNLRKHSFKMKKIYKQ
jgi:hypothetical protein